MEKDGIRWLDLFQPGTNSSKLTQVNQAQGASNPIFTLARGLFVYTEMYRWGNKLMCLQKGML